VTFVETPISPRFLSQDDRIEIADGLHRGDAVKTGVSRQLCKPDVDQDRSA